MKILVLSDSHSSLSFMRLCVRAIEPDAIIHLGDYVSDGEALSETFPSIPFYQVAGNCDRNRMSKDYPEVLIKTIGGKQIFMTHGHLHGVKLYRDKLIMDAEKRNVDIVLYGHTHEADCTQLETGMWVMNPGSCGFYGGSVGIIEIDANHNALCRIVRQSDMEGLYDHCR